MKKNEKITILCYGDSNTWGCIGKWEENTELSKRYGMDVRWPSVLQKNLGEKYHVIEEGLGGRTSIYEPPTEAWKNGETYLVPCLHSHYPLDLVVFMLGTNDLQIKKDITAEELPKGISRLIDIVRQYSELGRDGISPEILIIAPPEIRPSAPEGRTAVYAKFRCEIGRELSLLFPKIYAQVAKEKGCYFLDSQKYVQPCPADGVHFEEESHIRLGQAVAQLIENEIFPQ